MNDFRLHKRKLIVNLLVFLILAIVSVFLIIASATAFKNQWTAIVLLLIVLAQIPIVLSVVLLGNKIINEIIAERKSNVVLQEAELDNYEKEVEEKVKEADDLSFNLSRLGDEIGKHDDWQSYGAALLKALSKQLEIVTGMVYMYKQEAEVYSSVATFAYYSDNQPADFKIGEGLSGQVVKDNKAIFLSDIPDGYIEVVSGLGKNAPNYMALIPIYKNGKVIGVVELASFKSFGDSFIRRIKDISEYFGNLAPMI